MSVFRKAFFLSCCAGLFVSVVLLPEGVLDTVCSQTFSMCIHPKIRLPSPLSENSSGYGKQSQASNALKKTYVAGNSVTIPPGLLHPAIRGSGCSANVLSAKPPAPPLSGDRLVTELTGLIKCLTQLPLGSVYDMLSQTLNSTTEDLRPMLRELQVFRSQFACRSCIDDRPPPVTDLGIHARLRHNVTWQRVQMPIVTFAPQGRLGNLMSEYASLFALKEIYGASAVLIGHHSTTLRAAFNGITIPAAKKVIQLAASRHRWTHISPHSVSGTTSYAAMQLAAGGLLGPRLFQGGGYPSELQLFAAYRAQLRQEFSCKSKIENRTRKKLSSISGGHKSSTRAALVGVHVRLGDYTSYLTRKYNVKNLSYDKYLGRAVEYFTRIFGSVMFIATSDDIPATKKLLRKIGVNNSLITSGSAPEDMCLLSKCDHNIVTFGTFSFWTGFLGRGLTLYPDLHFPHRQYILSKQAYVRAKLDDFIPIPFH